MKNLSLLSDHDLFEKCRNYGLNAKTWMRKFIGLLPEVKRRKLYEKKGFPSIHVFAYELAGMNKEQVDRVFQIDRDFEDKPLLRTLLETGEVSMHKLARVTGIATEQTQTYWAEQVKILPQRALETLIRDHKALSVHAHEETNNLFSGEVETTDCGNCSISDIEHGQLEGKTFAGGSNQDDLAPAGEQKTIQPAVNLVPSSILKLKLSEPIIEKLLELQQKGIDINEFILTALEQREQEIEKEKEQIAIELKPTNSRYIPRKIKKLITKEHGTKCSIPTCSKP